MPTKNDDGRLLACFCSDPVDRILAVIRLTPALAREILTDRADFMARREQNARLDGIRLDNNDCRFFNEMSYGDEEHAAACEEIFAAADKAFEDFPEGVDGWFPLPEGFELPDTGDYRTSYEQLCILSGYTCWQGQGKHASEEFETADLPVEMLAEAAGESSRVVSKLTFELVTTHPWDEAGIEKVADEFHHRYAGNLNVQSACLVSVVLIPDPSLEDEEET